MKGDQVATAIREYHSLFDASESGDLAARKKHYDIVVNHFYDLVTDFYEFGWGDSFHFAPRRKGEDFWASIRRCERNFADRLGLKPGMIALDVGCGVGGPMREVARHSGAKVVGINNNVYQVRKVENLQPQAGPRSPLLRHEGRFPEYAHSGCFVRCDLCHRVVSSRARQAAGVQRDFSNTEPGWPVRSPRMVSYQSV